MITENEQQHNNPYQRQLYNRLYLQEDFKQIETVSTHPHRTTSPSSSSLTYIHLHRDELCQMNSDKKLNLITL